ncbi:MAG TPA: DUF72 domain-containing protein [Gemmataceae bacterium]|nr:DUF72 domain-containing protein [Gemmataceae bacterium]
MQIWIGTSGYSYPDWVGGFYPPDIRSGKMLAYYCQHFPLVELNFTFYRLPTAAMLTRLAEQTPAGFQFLVKLPRTLSHEANGRDIAGFRHAVHSLQGQGRLLGLLCQLPQACHDLPRHRGWLETLAQEFADYHLAVEFRHSSWFRAEVTAWLTEHHLDLVSVDVPKLPGLFPRGLIQSSPVVYVRFHSRNAENWYRSDKDRYDFDYDDQALGEWIEALRRNDHPSNRVLLLFNNCQRSQAAANAQRMRELLSRMGAGMEIVAPFAAPASGSQQRLLFD